MGKISNLRIAFFLGIVFFFAGLFTLKDYGINWDTINHLPRGQAYLHYFLTGRKDYSDLQKFFYDWTDKSQWYWQNPDSLAINTDIPFNKVPTRSLYQTSVADFNYFMATDGDGHPPLSDILSSVFNRVLFGKLRIINDIDSYRVYGVFLASLLVGLIFWWVSKVYGRLAGIISALSLGLYPLFWSEMHFNTEKDVPETVYWSFMFFAVWQALTKKSWKWMIAAGILFGLALGTKFNILFAVLALAPWILLYLLRNFKDFLKFRTLLLIGSAISAFVLGVAIFIGSWPYLWPDPLGRIGRVIGFYKGIGIASNVDVRFIGPFGLNTYSIQWIIYATPIIILVFTLIGLILGLIRFKKEKDLVSILFILWLLVPIARVSWSHANTYGGVRQIMEYIPAMAVLSGLGGSFILHKLKIQKYKLKVFLVAILFGVLLVPIVSTHPNENVYFNALIGGLSGAKAKDFPYWGFSFGEAYRRGIEWIDANAENGANVVYAYELIPNIPRLWVRPDLSLYNSNRSGYLAKGEYAITLTYQGTESRSYYDSYLERFLTPVYQDLVDNTAILKVWKNDKEHLKNNWTEKKVLKATVIKNDAGLFFNLDQPRKLSRLEINYVDNSLCKPLMAGYVEISADGNSWERLPGVLPDDWRISLLGEQPSKGRFIEPFLGQTGKIIHISLNPVNTCLSNIKNYSVYYFE